MLCPLLLLAALSAPAPLPKGEVSLPLPLDVWIEGSYRGQSWSVWFHRPDLLTRAEGASYVCFYGGSTWSGRYHWDAKSRTLWVRERVGSEDPWHEFSIRLDSRLRAAEGPGSPAADLGPRSGKQGEQ